MVAADYYVEYRYLHDGSFPDYKKRKELEGDTGIYRHYRGWFPKIRQGTWVSAVQPWATKQHP